MNETTKAAVATDKDAAIQTSMNTISWLQHWAVARKRSVGVNEWELFATVTWSLSPKARHLARVLFALDEIYRIGSGRNMCIGAFEGMTDFCAVYR